MHRELDGQAADDARGSGDQHGGAGGEPQQVHGAGGGEAGQREPRRGHRVHGDRGGRDGGRVEHHVLRVRAQRLHRPVVQAHDPVADAPAGHAGADLVDLPGHVPAEAELLPGAAEDPGADRAVHRVEAGGGDLDAELAGCGAGRRDLGQFDLLRAAEPGHHGRQHRLLAHLHLSRSPIRSLIRSRVHAFSMSTNLRRGTLFS